MLTLTQLRALVLDEADRLLGEGFEAQVRLILAQAPALGIFLGLRSVEIVLKLEWALDGDMFRPLVTALRS